MKRKIVILVAFLLMLSIPLKMSSAVTTWLEDGNDVSEWETYYFEAGDSLTSATGYMTYQSPDNAGNSDGWWNNVSPVVRYSVLEIRYRVNDTTAYDYLEIWLYSETNFGGTWQEVEFDNAGIASDIWYNETTSVTLDTVGTIDLIVNQNSTHHGNIKVELDYIRLGPQWEEQTPVTVLVIINLDTVPLDFFFILVGLIMIPVSTLYLVRGGRDKLGNNKVFYFLLIFFMGWAFILGGIMP